MDKKINFKYLMTAFTFAFLLLIMAVGGSLSKSTHSAALNEDTGGGLEFNCSGTVKKLGNNYYCCKNNVNNRPFSTKEACDEWKKKSYPFVENTNYYINFNSGTTDTTCSVSYYAGCAGVNPVSKPSSSSSSSSTVSTSGECSVSIAASEIVTGGATFQVTATTKINGSGVSVKSYTWNSGGTGYLLGSGPNGIFNSSSNTDVRSFTSVAVDGTKVAGSVMVTLSNGKTCSSSFSSTVKVDGGNDDENTIVTKFMNGDSLVESKTCYKNKEPLCERGISTPGPQSKEGYTFNGWGNYKSCTAATLASNYNITPSTSMIYYACFTDKSNDPELPSDFTYSKCTYGTYASVVNDVRYLGCKYVGVGYGTSTSDREDRNITTVKTCCKYKGYTWVSENYDAAGGEYCIMCGGSSSSKPSSSSSSSKPSSSSSIPSSSSLNNPIDNPKTGTALIFIVWSIGISIIIYSVWYFKNSKGNA